MKESPFNEKEARFVFRQILEVLHHLHSMGIVHRDLKLENILFDSHKRQVKVADFGLSRIVGDEGLRTFCGTMEYLGRLSISGFIFPHQSHLLDL